MRISTTLWAVLALLPSLALAGAQPEEDATQASADSCPIIARIGPSVMVGKSEALAKVRDVIARAAKTKIPVLIQGETGTGKELVANSLYTQGGAKGPFVVVNMAVVPETLADALFFGSEKGAFTGSVKQQKGFFESADGGTIFLDEIGEMPLPLQAKLLRVLDNYGFNRVGGSALVKPKFRLICATNRDLYSQVQKKLFREDLFYRLQVLTIQLPPLRDRKEDIGDLAHHLLTEIRGTDTGEYPGREFSPAAVKKLTMLDWDGNIRELRSVVTRAYLAAAGETIGADDIVLLPQMARGEHYALVQRIDSALTSGNLEEIRQATEELDRARFEIALKQAGGVASRAATALGISLAAFNTLARQYGLIH